MNSQPNIAGTEISVIICTWNRADILKQCLEALEKQTFDVARFEVVVVDNNSSDSTSEIIEAFGEATQIRFKSVLETRQGLSIARNRGIAESCGKYVVFLDDDSVAAPAVLGSIKDAFEDLGADVVAGKVICVRPSALKSDLPAEYLEKMTVSALDLGAETREMLAEEYPVGANLSFRRSLLDNIGVFKEYLGYVGKRKLVGEDTEICERAKNATAVCIWAPSAVVYHYPPASRFTVAALRVGSFQYGEGRFYHKHGRTLATNRRVILTLQFASEVLLRSIVWALVSWSRCRRFKAELKLRILLGKLYAVWHKPTK